MSINQLRKYIPDSPKEFSFLGGSIVRLSSALSAGLQFTEHSKWSIITILLAWAGYEWQEYFKLHEPKARQ